MSVEIPKEDWTQFFNDLSKNRFAWETKVEVMIDLMGKQTLSNGLHLNGVNFEEKSDTSEIEISVAKDNKQHQLHSISNPVKVLYLDEDKFHDSQIEIIEHDGTITYLRIFNPLPITIRDDTNHSV